MEQAPKQTFEDHPDKAVKLLWNCIQQILYFHETDGKKGRIVDTENTGDALTEMAIEALAIGDLETAKHHIDELRKWIDADRPVSKKIP